MSSVCVFLFCVCVFLLFLCVHFIYRSHGFSLLLFLRTQLLFFFKTYCSFLSQDLTTLGIFLLWIHLLAEESSPYHSPDYFSLFLSSVSSFPVLSMFFRFIKETLKTICELCSISLSPAFGSAPLINPDTFRYFVYLHPTISLMSTLWLL